MGRKRNNTQMKGKEEASERMLTEKEASELSDTESKQWLSVSSLSSLSSQRATRNYREITINSLKTIST